MTGERSAPTPSMNAQAQSHEELKAMTDAAQPAGAQAVADGWAQLAAGFDEAVTLFDQALRHTESGWTGAAADAMRAHLAKVAGWSRAMSAHYQAAGTAIGNQADTAASAKSAMPPPVPYDPAGMIRQARESGDIFQMAALPFRMYEQKRAHDEAHDEAARVVTERDQAFGSAASRIPPFEPPPRLADTQVEVVAPASAPPAPAPAAPAPFGPANAAAGLAFGPAGPVARVPPAPRSPDAYPAGPPDGPGKRPEYLVESDLPGMFGSAELTSPPVIGEA